MSELKPIQITKANLEQALAIGDLCFPKENDRKHFRSTFYRLLTGDNTYWWDDVEREVVILQYFVYYLINEPCGIGGLYKFSDEPDCIWQGWLGVHPNFRREGLGSNIVEHCSEEAKSLGAKRIAVYTDLDQNDDVIEFYRSQGFADTETSKIEGDECLILEKPL